MRKILSLFLILVGSAQAKAQSPNGYVGIGNAIPKAKLDIVSDTSGILIPRYATLVDVNSNVLPKMSATDHNGLTLYVAEAANRGFWFYNGTAFEKIGAGSGSGGFFKVSSTDANHIIYSSDTNYGKNFLVNADSVNYDGSGTDAKMMLIPSKYAVRLGAIENANWDTDSIGYYSFAAGYNTKANGNNSTAMGVSTIASGYISTALGYETISSAVVSTAMGGRTTASADYSTAMGANTTASGGYSTAMGSETISSGLISTAMGSETISSAVVSTAMGGRTTASADYSTAMGNSTTASGNNSTAMGVSTTASGSGSTAMGSETISSAVVSTAIGGRTTASADYSTAMGNTTTASGNNSTAMGNGTIASGITALATGLNSTATGNSSTAIGETSNASGIASTAIGTVNNATGDYATAIGFYSNATGNESVAVGNDANAKGYRSSAFGINSIARGETSITIGNNTIAKSFAEVATGIFNDTLITVDETSFANDSNRVFTVGNGTFSARNTAFVIQQNGNVGINTRVPSEKLDITGSIKIVDGTEGVGKVLTSDANGKGSWAAVPSSSFFKVSTSDTNHIIYSDATKYSKNFLVNTDSINYDGSGTDVKMMFIPSKSALRMGSISNNSWNIDSIGTGSVAMGSNSKATGATGVSLGFNTLASGSRSVALGFRSEAKGVSSLAMNNWTFANGNGSTSMGYITFANADYSIASGYRSESSGNISSAFGENTRTKSYSEFGIGSFNDTLSSANATAFAGDTNRVFTIGNGTLSARNTAFVVQQNGNVGVGDRKPSSLLDINGSLSLPFQSITTDYTATINDYTIRFSGSTASQTVTLPAASDCTGRMYRIVNAGSVALGISSIINLAGTATTSLSATTAVLVQSDGTNWYSIQ